MGECYFQHGRVAMTVELQLQAAEAHGSTKKTSVMAITSSAVGAILNATSYQMNDVHTTIEDVLA